MTPSLGDRSLFPTLAAPHYLNFAAVSPLSTPVVQAMRSAVDLQAEGGVAAIEAYAGSVGLCRSRFGELVGAAAADVALVANTSAGVTAVATCLDWRVGDRVLLFRGDFPANVTPWLQAARQRGLEVRWLDGDRFRTEPDAILADVDRELARGVRLVALSAVSFSTGLRRPVEAIAARCVEAGAELFVDAIQAVGVSPVRMDCGIDYLAVGGHKWLGGPFGTGLLAVAPQRWGQLTGQLASWLSHEEPFGFLSGDEGLLRYDRPLRAGPALFEGGAFNGVGAAGLAASMGLLLELGVQSISEHVDGLNGRLSEGLRDLGLVDLRSSEPASRAGALVVDLPGGEVGRVARDLGARGVSVSTPDGHLRFAPHWPSAPGDVDAAVTALGDVLRAHR